MTELIINATPYPTWYKTLDDRYKVIDKGDKMILIEEVEEDE